MENPKKNIYKYNMSFYYQSTIIYLVVFMIYVIIRGEFIEGSYILVTKDPIIYFFGIIVLVSIISLLYNLYKNRHIEFSDREISFVNRFKTKSVQLENIAYIKLFKEKDGNSNRAFRLIRIILKNRKRPLIIRPYDYENENDLINELQALKNKVDSHNV
ncbi:MAG: hypothetical protein P4L27_04845 [Ignavibacteriaceae bacterium]|nr:hypothetical protein [Ignavibacteriaceae bacterium]